MYKSFMEILYYIFIRFSDLKKKKKNVCWFKKRFIYYILYIIYLYCPDIHAT